MPYLVAAVVLAGVVCVLNLVFAVTLARRLRECGGLLARQLPHGYHRPLSHRLPPGSQIGDFSASTVAGDTVSLGTLSASKALVGFFSPACAPCREQFPAFAELAQTMLGGSGQVLAVVAGDPDRASEFAAGLDGVASVVLESLAGPLASAFSVQARPAFFLLDPGGKVASNAPALAMLTSGLAATELA